MMITPIVDLNQRKELIRKQACFSQLREDEIEDLAKLLGEKRFLAGEIIVTEGDRVDSFYLLVSGIVDVRTVSYENSAVPQSKSIATLSGDKYDAIGLNETGFYSLTGLRTSTVVAKTDVVTLFLTVPLFHGFTLASPHVSEVMREQSAKLTFGR